MSFVRHNFDLVYELTKKELKVRYKSSLLGYVWSLLNPLAMAVVFHICFSVFLKVRLTDSPWPYVLFLITALFPWQWLSNSVTAGTNVYVTNANLIRKVAFRREILPLATVLNDLFHFLMSIPVILVMLWCFGGQPSWRLIYGLPAFILSQFLLTYGLALIVASVNLFFRDLTHLITIFMTMLYFLTPILFDMKTVAKSRPDIIPLLKCNPLTPLMEGYRQLFLDGVFCADLFGLSLAYGLAALAIGWAVYTRLRWRFAEVA